MSKTTAFFAFLFLSVLLQPCFGGSNLENYPHITKIGEEVPADYFHPADTIPVGEDFDAPLSGARFTPYDSNPFDGKSSSPKVIPIIPIEVDNSYSQVQKIPQDFTGFRIEIMAVEEPLPDSHDIFFQHGNLTVEKLNEKAYSYTLGNFSNAAEATDFMANFLQQRYPKARVVEYEQGKRIN